MKGRDQWRTPRFGTAVAALFLLAGCGQGGGPRAGLDPTLTLFNWAHYMDPAVLEDFTKEFGVKVTLESYVSNEELLAKLQGGTGGYDIIVPSDYMVATLREQGLLEPLEVERVPNLKHIEPAFRDGPFDPGPAHCAPYLWGTTGIAYDSERVPAPDSWRVLWESRYRGRISMLSDPRETIGAALKALGQSLNSTDPKTLRAAADLLRRQKPLVKVYTSDTYAELLLAGEVWLAHAWSGDVARVAQEKPSLKYVLPKEGSTIYMDHLCIPKGAPHKKTAEALINYLLRPEVAARLVTFTRHPSPNEGARALLPPALLNDPTVLPSAEARARLEWMQDLGETTRLYDRLWAELRIR
ncbi:MAG TPA: spermidine/putrescine ABC transporter substrate-binding protein [Candidatus Methylomirabilis sp.]|jgi:spermidine/putrescine-binding protein|nr:spermidine/putrescine ABC transporter substrate-binding protein [Candidatus Methylomirabilis sp.]